MGSSSPEAFPDSVRQYEQWLPMLRDEQLICELGDLKTKWSKVPKEDMPITALNALDHCGSRFPNVAELLKILAALPVPTSSAERSFSSLKYVKSYVRSTMV